MNKAIEISEINDIRFVANTDNIRNYKNELSWQENTAINHKTYAQEILKDTYHTVQLKSYLTDLQANVYKLCDSKESVLTPVITQKTNNIGKVSVLSGFYGSYEIDGVKKQAVYFSDGELPSYMKVGVLVALTSTGGDPTTGTYRPIERIVFDIDRDVYLAVFENDLNQIDLPRAVAVKYDAQDYEVFEFVFNPETLEEGYHFIEVTGSDEETEYLEISEVLHVSVTLYKTHRIDYFNSKNNDVLFSTGIGFTLHLPYEITETGNIESENTTITTDSDIYQTDSSAYLLLTYNFQMMPYGMAKKVLMAFSQDNVFVDGVPVVRTESELSRLGVTNMYRLSVTAKQTSEDLSGGLLIDAKEFTGYLFEDEGALLSDSDGRLITVPY